MWHGKGKLRLGKGSRVDLIMIRKNSEKTVDLKKLFKKMFLAFILGGMLGIIWFLAEIYIGHEAGAVVGGIFIVLLIGFLIINFTKVFKMNIKHMDEKKDNQTNFFPVSFFFFFFIAFEFIRKMLGLIDLLRLPVIFIYPLVGIIVILLISRKCSPINKTQRFWLWFSFVLTNLWYVYVVWQLIG